MKYIDCVAQLFELAKVHDFQWSSCQYDVIANGERQAMNVFCIYSTPRKATMRLWRPMDYTLEMEPEERTLEIFEDMIKHSIDISSQIKSASKN